MTNLVNVYLKKSENKKLDSRKDSCVITMNSMGINNPGKDIINDAHYLIIRVCSNNPGIETDRFILEIPKKIIQDITHTTQVSKGMGTFEPVWNGTFVFKTLIRLCECGYNSETLCHPDCVPIEKYIIQNIIRTGFFYYDDFLHMIKRKKKNDEEFSYQGKTYIIS